VSLRSLLQSAFFTGNTFNTGPFFAQAISKDEIIQQLRPIHERTIEMRILRTPKRHSNDVETGLVEFLLPNTILWRIARILIVVGLPWVPLIASPDRPNAQLSGGGVTFCGVVRAVHLFDQTFVIWRDDGNVETVPFSRRTGFIRISTDSKRRKYRQPIEPTDIEIGERLSILLDPNEATAEHVDVLPIPQLSFVCRIARRHPTLLASHRKPSASSYQDLLATRSYVRTSKALVASKSYAGSLEPLKGFLPLLMSVSMDAEDLDGPPQPITLTVCRSMNVQAYRGEPRFAGQVPGEVFRPPGPPMADQGTASADADLRIRRPAQEHAGATVSSAKCFAAMC
jgi:hypothetical protein